MTKKLFFSIVIILIGIGVLVFAIKGANSAKISAVIVPHHDLAKDLRSDFLADISKKIQPKTIILVSPNHFFAGNYDVITTGKVWNLGSNLLYADKSKIQSLLNDNLIYLQDSAFFREHGITNILNPISVNFPSAKIIPIIIKENTSIQKIKPIVENLNKNCRRDCLVIASVDCSHYQPADIAGLHDDFTLRALSTLNQDNILQSEVDSPESLYFAASWAKLHSNNYFNLFKNTNSGIINNNQDVETTSYILGSFEQGKIKPIDRGFTFMIGGRVNQDNFSYDTLKNLGSRFFWGTDLSMLDTHNLSEYQQQILTKFYHLNYLPDFSSLQIRDFHNQNETIQLITASDKSSQESIIKSISPDNFTIIYYSDVLQSDFARQLIDNGADLVIGSDSILSDKEIYKNRQIFYSLGMLNIPQSKSIVLFGNIANNKLNLQIAPIINNPDSPQLLRGQEKKL